MSSTISSGTNVAPLGTLGLFPNANAVDRNCSTPFQVSIPFVSPMIYHPPLVTPTRSAALVIHLTKKPKLPVAPLNPFLACFMAQVITRMLS